jgi:hypothetical protein
MNYLRGWITTEKVETSAANFDHYWKSVTASAIFALRQDCGVQAFAQVGRELVEFVGAIDFDGFLGGVQGNDAVFAALQVLF